MRTCSTASPGRDPSNVAESCSPQKKSTQLQISKNLPPDEKFILVGMASLECRVIDVTKTEKTIGAIDPEETTLVPQKIAVGRLWSRCVRRALLSRLALSWTHIVTY